MSFMLAAGIAGTALSAYGQYQAGKSAKKASQFEAQQMQAKAKVAEASSQRTAQDIERQGRLQLSRALAVAAASGGGATDPTVMNIMGDLAGETNYRKLVALYEGKEAAAGLNLGAESRLEEGKNAFGAGKIGALSTSLSGASSLYAKYGFNNKPAQQVLVNK